MRSFILYSVYLLTLAISTTCAQSVTNDAKLDSKEVKCLGMYLPDTFVYDYDIKILHLS